MAFTQSIGGMVLVGARRVDGNRTCFRLSVGDGWKDIPWAEVARATREVALGLLELGTEVGDRVAILAEPTPTSVYFGLAVTALRGVCVPLWPHTPPERLAEMVRATEATTVVLRSRRDVEVVRAALDTFAPDVRFLVPDPRAEVDGERFLLVEDLRDRGRQGAKDDVLRRHLEEATVDAPAFVFVKRSSGLPPRLVTLSHGNVLAATEAAVGGFPLTRDDLMFCARPLADPAAWSAGVLASVHAQIPIAFEGGRDLLDELGEVAPTVLLAAPDDLRALDVRLRGEARGKSLGRALAVAAQAAAHARDGEGAPAMLRLRHALAARRVLKGVHARLGARLRRVVTWGGAPTAPAVGLFAALGLEVLDAYSLTEAAGLVAVSDAPGGSPLARPLGANELLVAPGGKLRVRGPALATAATGRLAGGWFEPGDRAADPGDARAAGRADAPPGDGPAIELLGRQNAEFPCPNGPVWTDRVVARLVEGPFLRNAVVVAALGGDGLRAHCEPDLRALSAWAVAQGLPTPSHDELLGRAEEQALLRRLVAAVNADLPEAGRLTAVWLYPGRWSVEAGHLTAAGTVDRHAVLADTGNYVRLEL